MANRQRAEARRKAAAKAQRQESSSKLWIWIGVGVVAVVAIIAGIVVLGGGDDSSASDSTTVATDNALSNLPDSQPVTITGDPLPDFSATDGDPAVGTKAPVVVGKNFQGDTVTIDGATNGPTMVVFLAHWCPHCNREVPVLLDWKNSGQVPAGLNVVGVATAVSSGAVNYPPAKWFSEKGWSWPVMVDEKVDDNASAGTTAQAFGATGWPYIVFIDKDGNVTARSSGEKTVAEITALAQTAMG